MSREREALALAYHALRRVQPQITGILPQQDVETALAKASEVLGRECAHCGGTSMVTIKERPYYKRCPKCDCGFSASDDGPRYTHDCSLCIYLGRFDGADLYYHPRISPAHGTAETLVARYGSEGSNYTSGWSFRESCPDLAEAERLAKARGLIT